MIVRTVGLGAACLALVAESIMIPSTVTLPGLTAESVHRGHEDNSNDDEVQTLPIPEDFLEKFKDLHLGVSKPMPDFSFSEDNDGEAFTIEVDLDDFDWHNFEEYLDDWDLDEFEQEMGEIEAGGHGSPFVVGFDDLNEDSSKCPSGSSFKAIVCRVRSTLESKVEELKPYFSHHRRPCPKKIAALAKEKANKGLNRPPISGGLPKFWPIFHPDEAMPDSHHEHHSHHHHHEHLRNKFHKVLHKICAGLRVFITGFLIPVLIGVAAGMTASLLGMCVGTFLAWLWIKFVRGGKRGNARGRVMLDESDESAAVKSEKEGLLETGTEEAPPTYVERE